jgi:hypothetical protein
MKDATHLKFEAERELDKVREEIERKKITNIVYEDRLCDILEKHAPHNNLHIPISEVNPIYLAAKKNSHNKLRSEEEFVEINKPMSNLAKVGKTFITKSEFVPIEDGRTDYNAPNELVNYNMNRMNDSASNFRDLYSKLNEISELNNNRGVKSKYTTMAKNYEVNIHSNNPETYERSAEKIEFNPDDNKALLINNDNIDFPYDESLKLT